MNILLSEINQSDIFVNEGISFIIREEIGPNGFNINLLDAQENNKFGSYRMLLSQVEADRLKPHVDFPVNRLYTGFVKVESPEKTPDRYNKKGFGTMLINLTEQQLLIESEKDKNIPLTHLVYLHNPIIHAIHTRLGYKEFSLPEHVLAQFPDRPYLCMYKLFPQNI